jgi:hypothetical protein
MQPIKIRFTYHTSIGSNYRDKWAGIKRISETVSNITTQRYDVAPSEVQRQILAHQEELPQLFLSDFSRQLTHLEILFAQVIVDSIEIDRDWSFKVGLTAISQPYTCISLTDTMAFCYAQDRKLISTELNRFDKIEVLIDEPEKADGKYDIR